MNQERTPYFKTADLVINTNTGEVSNSKQKVRLSPVNIRVLTVLMKKAEKAVSRQQLFDLVWPNQEVSDDALTRSISDLRAQLKPLTAAKPLIETIPKVGYRWVSAVEKSDVFTASLNTAKTSIWSQHLKPILMALALLLILLWGLLGWLYFWSEPSLMSLVILPTENTQDIQTLPRSNKNDVSALLKQAVMEQGDMQYLSNYALESHSGNPFPYYSHEFGVRWFIESHLTQTTDHYNLTLNLVDAKTALVIYTQQHTLKSVDTLKPYCQNFIAFVSEL